MHEFSTSESVPENRHESRKKDHSLNKAIEIFQKPLGIPKAFLFLLMSGRKRKSNSRSLLLILFAIIMTGAYLVYSRYYAVKNRAFTTLNYSDLPEGFEGFGIDVSHYQGEIDWQALHDSLHATIGFVYLKATEGTTISDEYLNRNNSELDRLGILHGAYHFYIPSADPAAQAKHFLKSFKSEQKDLPPVLDVETEIADKSKLINGVKLWLAEVEKSTGRKAIIYTSFSMYSNLLKEHFKGYKFWIANYSRREERFRDPQILFWQYTDQAVLPGIKNVVDVNYSRINYTVD